MIIWITGQSESGKTLLAKQMKGTNKKIVIIDGDDLRYVWGRDKIGFSQKDRYEHNLRMARLAQILEDQGLDVIVASICPYEKLRWMVKKITNCSFIYLKGNKIHKDYPYEYEEDKCYFKK